MTTNQEQPTNTVVLTISLTKSNQMSVNIVNNTDLGRNLEPWELLGLLDSAKILVTNNYYNQNYVSTDVQK